MCAIFGSKNKDKFLELAELNQYRGNFAHSITVFQTGAFKHYRDGEKFVCITTNRGSGDFKDTIAMSEDEYKITYYLGHVQAPTTDSPEMHPSNINDKLLWHNGIIKNYQVEEWREEYGKKEWDTELLHRHILLGGKLDDVDGTFSCARYNKEDILLFRNEISPLFYDTHLNISSTKFDDAVDTEAGVMYKMLLHNKILEPLYRFETKENPYYFGE